MINELKKYYAAFLIVLFLAAIYPFHKVYAQACVGGLDTSANQTLPVGLEHYMILSSEETFFAPGFSSVASGDDFDTNIMGRDAAASELQKQAAISFFLTQYGIDFTGGDTSADGNWDLFHLAIVPEYNQRIVYSGNQTVPQSGWLVHQGFYRMATTGAGPFTLYGVWGGVSGKQVLPGTFADFGEFRIKIPCQTSGFQDLDLDYFSLRPNFIDILAGAFGPAKGYNGARANIDYEISLKSNPNIKGTARGRVELKSLGGDNYKSQARAVLRLFPE